MREPQVPCHILYVDSDLNAHERLRQALGSGFAVQSATSVAEAKQGLEEHLPNILICEVRIGHESGLELCRTVRRTSTLRHLPIMILTSHMTIQDKVAGFEAGADDYVVKPFDTRHLVARIRLLSRIKRLQQINEV